MRTVRVAGLLLVAGALAGCGGGEPPAPAAPAADPAPIASVAPALEDLEATRREGLALGLDRLEVDQELAAAGAEAEDPRFADAARARSFGPAPRPIAESARPIVRESPRALLGSALDALAAGDVAALCRLSAAKDEEPVLDEEDAEAARRRFLDAGARPAWDRIGAAARAGQVEVVPDPTSPERATLRVQTGGALGAYELPLIQRGDGWYLAR